MYDGVGRRSDQSSGRFLNIGQHSLNGYERNCLFRNTGDGRFLDVAYVNAADRVEDGRGLSVFDYDEDGQLDLLLRNYHQPAHLLRNQGGANHWVELRLVGTRSNRDAIGARVRVLAGGRWQTRVVGAGSGFVSSHSLVQHVGLGQASTVERIEIDWPAGHQSVHGPLPGDRRHEIVEPSAAGAVRAATR